MDVLPHQELGLREPPWIVSPRHWDASCVLADLPAIRRYNPQRDEMEQLTAVLYEDTQRHICLGCKDLTSDEFWVRGSALQPPTMPGILMCEAAAQLANYYACKHGLYAVPGAFLGLNEVRWLRAVGPGTRLFVLAELLKIHASVLTCRFQCAIQPQQLVCEGVLMGTPLRKW
jgi:3-hydroxyacyl-[acyl-carrier-protein] dehydratase